jgi:hypothetical protein
MNDIARCSLQATAPVKLHVEEALNKGVGSFQELLQQQKDTLRLLQEDYSSYVEQACVHPSVVMAQRYTCVRSPDANERMKFTPGIMHKVTSDAMGKDVTFVHITRICILISGLQSRENSFHKPPADLYD